MPCCDVCDPSLVPAAPVAAPRQRALAPAGDLDGAILDVVARAEPGVGRTRCVEILRGGRSKVIAKHSYDGLPNYGAYRDLRAEEVLAAIDALLDRRHAALDRRRASRSWTARVTRLRVGVLASGAGTNLQAILDRVHGREAEVVAVGSDKPGAQALEPGRGGRHRRPASFPRRRVRRPRGARRRDGDVAASSRASSWSCSRATCSCSAPRSSPRSRCA